jgi:hypothetical protein
MAPWVSLRDGTLKHLSNSILEPHHIDALLLLYNHIAFAFAVCPRYMLLNYRCHLQILFNLSVAAKAPWDRVNI